MSTPNDNYKCSAHSTALDRSPSLNLEESFAGWFQVDPNSSHSCVSHSPTDPHASDTQDDWPSGSPTLMQWTKRHWFPDVGQESVHHGEPQCQDQEQDQEQGLASLLLSSNSCLSIARKEVLSCSRTYSKVPVVSPVVEVEESANVSEMNVNTFAKIRIATQAGSYQHEYVRIHAPETMGGLGIVGLPEGPIFGDDDGDFERLEVDDLFLGHEEVLSSEENSTDSSTASSERMSTIKARSKQLRKTMSKIRSWIAHKF